MIQIVIMKKPLVHQNLVKKLKKPKRNTLTLLVRKYFIKVGRNLRFHDYRSIVLLTFYNVHVVFCSRYLPLLVLCPAPLLEIIKKMFHFHLNKRKKIASSPPKNPIPRIMSIKSFSRAKKEKKISNLVYFVKY